MEVFLLLLAVVWWLVFVSSEACNHFCRAVLDTNTEDVLEFTWFVCLLLFVALFVCLFACLFIYSLACCLFLSFFLCFFVGWLVCLSLCLFCCCCVVAVVVVVVIVAVVVVLVLVVFIVVFVVVVVVVVVIDAVVSINCRAVTSNLFQQQQQLFIKPLEITVDSPVGVVAVVVAVVVVAVNSPVGIPKRLYCHVVFQFSCYLSHLLLLAMLL